VIDVSEKQKSDGPFRRFAERRFKIIDAEFEQPGVRDSKALFFEAVYHILRSRERAVYFFESDLPVHDRGAQVFYKAGSPRWI